MSSFWSILCACVALEHIYFLILTTVIFLILYAVVFLFLNKFEEAFGLDECRGFRVIARLDQDQFPEMFSLRFWPLMRRTLIHTLKEVLLSVAVVL